MARKSLCGERPIEVRAQISRRPDAGQMGSPVPASRTLKPSVLAPYTGAKLTLGVYGKAVTWATSTAAPWMRKARAGKAGHVTPNSLAKQGEHVSPCARLTDRKRGQNMERVRG